MTATVTIWERLHTQIPETEAPKRNYGAEIREAIERAIPTLGTYTSRGVAAEIVAYLRLNDPELLAGWLDQEAEHFMASAIGVHDVNARSRMRRAASRSVFVDAAKEHENGNPVPLLRNIMNTPYVVSRDGTRKRLGAMTATDLYFVADRHDTMAKRNSFEAAFLKALAEKVGDDTVADHFTEEEIARMRQSIQSN